jgi:hypothetical protein
VAGIACALDTDHGRIGPLAQDGSGQTLQCARNQIFELDFQFEASYKPFLKVRESNRSSWSLHFQWIDIQGVTNAVRARQPLDRGQ